jgi:alpha-glucosidase
MERLKNKNKGTSFNKSIGQLISHSVNESGLVLQTKSELIDVEIYSPSIIRIRIRKKENDVNSFSYSVVAAKPSSIDFNTVDSPEEIIVNTSALIIRIKKAQTRFSFYTLDGKLINADDEAFGTSWIGNEVTTYKKMHPKEKYIGMGEKTGPLNRRGKAYTHWNTDKFGYGVDADPIYLSTPFFIGINEELPYGIFFDNSHKSTVSFGASNDRFMYFSAVDGEMDYYFIHHPKVEDIIKSYSFLTGTMEMPALWSLGFQQCRYSYYPESEPLNAARTFREKDIPCDVIYLDIHYMESYKVFTWHPTRFPNPKRLTEELKNLGFNLVVILDPGIKVENGYKAYEEGVKENYFVTYPDNEIYKGQVWPGWSAFPDFTAEEVRDWWGKSLNILTDVGIEGFWNDMNEPAAWGQHLPELIEFDYEGNGAAHKKARNVYGMQMARATYEGAKKQLGGKRPFVLTRAGFCGIQRYAAVWTGDNVSSDEHMMAGVRLVNSMGLAGVANAGYDIGGFAGECTAPLFARWIAIGAFSPFFRTHAMVNSRDSEPWTYGEEVEDISRNFIKLRYKLMPYLYSVFYEAATSGMPVARSLAIDYTHDEKIYSSAFQNQYLFGPAILVAPVESSKEYCKVYLPEGKWYDFFTVKAFEGNSEHLVELHKETLPLYIKAGSIICMQSDVPNLKTKPKDILDIHLYEGADHTFEYYEDDGDTFEYKNGKYFKRKIHHLYGQKKLVFDKVEGNYSSHFKNIRLFFHGFAKYKDSVKLNGQDLKITLEHISFVEPLSDFDPYHKPPKDRVVIMDINTVEFKNSNQNFEITWG